MTAAYSIEELRLAAQRRLPRALYDFFDGGAEDEVTLQANRSAFQAVRFRPQVLRDVSEVNTQTQLFGRSIALPMATAPTGALGYGYPGADVAIAKAGAAAVMGGLDGDGFFQHDINLGHVAVAAAVAGADGGDLVDQVGAGHHLAALGQLGG